MSDGPAVDHDLPPGALSPDCVAVIGASEDTNKTGGRAVHYLRHFGFGGRIFPVNPGRDLIQGLACYPSPSHLPQAPDLAIIAVPGEAALEAVAQCAERGVGCAVVTTSGFAETGEEGRRLEREMVRAARCAGMRIVGPNSQGVANFSNRFVGSFSSLFLQVAPRDGPIAIVSQSGSMSVVPYAELRARGLGVRYSISTGNEADLTVADFAKAAALDPDIRLILLYLEAIADPARLAEAARLARDRDVPIVAIKSGRSRRGQRAAVSHTGALAHEDSVIDAFFARHGIWRAADPDELVRAAPLYVAGHRPRGKRLVILSDSGASGVMMTDTAERLGLEVAPLAPGARAALSAILPRFASPENPVDMTSALRTDPTLLRSVLEVVASEARADLLALAFPSAGAGYDVEGMAGAVAAARREHDLALALAVPQPWVAAPFSRAGLPVYASETEALLALAQIAGHAALLRRSPPRYTAVAPVSLPSGRSPTLSEAAALDFLEALSFPMVRRALCVSRAEVRAAYERLGPKVVLKGCSAEIAHKTEHALVSFGVTSAAGAEREFDRIQRRLQELEISYDGVILAEMVAGRRELVLGARVDPSFGPVLIAGEGGRYVEALRNVVTLLAPVSEDEVASALSRLPAARLWAGVRGEPPTDLPAFSALAAALGDLIVAAASEIASIDLNPIMVGAEGEGCCIVDALIERAIAPEGPGV